MQNELSCYFKFITNTASKKEKKKVPLKSILICAQISKFFTLLFQNLSKFYELLHPQSQEKTYTSVKNYSKYSECQVGNE